jgi:hypothetical protein
MRFAFEWEAVQLNFDYAGLVVPAGGNGVVLPTADEAKVVDGHGAF